jgi:hypothetical protein
MLFDLARVDTGASPAAFDSVLGKEGKLQIFSRAPGYSVGLSIRPPRGSNTDEAGGFSVGMNSPTTAGEPVEAQFRNGIFARIEGIRPPPGLLESSV